MNCEKCIYWDNSNKFYFECCCEEDRIQVLKDDEEARKNGYVEIDGRWIKIKKTVKKTVKKVKD